ncbi:glycosyltransferase family 4 protein [Candidatus Peribacteria bacterium]|nr:glycosyltransferase family 4 protein [Candidatus Peribacteria bacterium]
MPRRKYAQALFPGGRHTCLPSGQVCPLPYTCIVKLALVADWLTTAGGAERALAELHQLWPESPIFTTVAKPQLPGLFDDRLIHVTPLQRFYRMIRRHQVLLPLMPRAIEGIDFHGFDVIVSSSHAVGKGIIPPSNAVHVCYCHTPMRYAWEMENQYLDDFHVPHILRRRVKRELMRLRRWDLSTARRVDAFIANSSETAGRIERIYGRTSTVIPPPVQDRFFKPALVDAKQRSSLLAVGRLVPYKRFDLVVSAANELRLPLVIVGKGQEERRLKAMAGPTVTFRGRVTDEELPLLYASASAVLFPTHEDAGLVPVEAQACGTPVIAYGKGGTLDTVIDGKTGLFFAEQTVPSLIQALQKSSTIQFDPTGIREHAKQFSAERFRERIAAEVSGAFKRFTRA